MNNPEKNLIIDSISNLFSNLDSIDQKSTFQFGNIDALQHSLLIIEKTDSLLHILWELRQQISKKSKLVESNNDIKDRNKYSGMVLGFSTAINIVKSFVAKFDDIQINDLETLK